MSADQTERGSHTATLWINQDMLAMLLNLPAGCRVVACEGRMFPTGIRVVVEDPNFPLVEPDAEPPTAYGITEVKTDETGRRYVSYGHGLLESADQS